MLGPDGEFGGLPGLVLLALGLLRDEPTAPEEYSSCHAFAGDSYEKIMSLGLKSTFGKNMTLG